MRGNALEIRYIEVPVSPTLKVRPKEQRCGAGAATKRRLRLQLQLYLKMKQKISH